MILMWPTWHSTHFQEGGDNPKVEGQEFFPGSGKVKVAFPNEKYSTIMLLCDQTLSAFYPWLLCFQK
jgi:hypothetical protein